jgi:DNA segregation ATPase FtsK/SpoIIIE, S-DNA-T family
VASIGDTRRARTRVPLAPEGFSLRRVLMQAAGLALLVGAVLLALALATYTAADPSWDHAVDGPVMNALGLSGARISDALFQTIGLSTWLIPLVLLDWSVRLLLGRGLKRLWWRLLLLLPMLAAAALALSIFGLGGAFGQLSVRWLDRANLAPPLSAMAAAALVALMLLYVMGLSPAAAAQRWAERFSGLSAKPGLFRRWGARLALWRKAEAALDETPVRREPRLTPLPAAEGDEEDVMPPRRAATVDLPARVKHRAEPARQLALRGGDEHLLPPLDLLKEVPPAKAATINEESLQQNARLLESVLEDYGVRGQIVKVRPGPVVALYELEPAPGIKASRVIGLADDVARSMSAVSARIAVVPGRNVIGIELPNQRTEMVYLRELLATEAYEHTNAKLALVLGKDISGAPVIADLARMPHLLIAGTTGSGKSVGINTMILSILYRMPPDECKFIMIDPKMLELSVYDGIPHLLAPVVTEPKKAVMALKWTVREMENRYRAMSKLGVRNIEGYNQRLAEAAAKGETLMRRVQTGFDDDGHPVFEEQPLETEPLPLIIVVVDEMADLMLVAGKDIEAAIQRLAQMARAAGIHIVMATQRPSVDVITGTIKANFPTRISFQVTSKIDSRTILGEAGAEQLLGRGDMLYMAGGGRITRVHGPFVSDEEVESVVRFLKENGAAPEYLDEVTEDSDEPSVFGEDEEGGGSGDALYDQAVALVCRERKASTSFVQRYLQIGYNRAARIIERMEAEGVVSPANHVGKREVLARKAE